MRERSINKEIQQGALLVKNKTMQNKTKNNNNSNTDNAPKQKERHIVSWSQEEDDILREQIRVHGTENWTIIASKFKDKTTRQCRRRWYTYLNSDFKKGEWSPEEDMLLCEAQKLFGNRWTEIAKVVSGRTDNAVKNRFTTLCKKRAKHEALAKKNNTSYINLNNKRDIFQNGITTNSISEAAAPVKKIRSHISDKMESCSHEERSLRECSTENEQLRPPFTVLVNFHAMGDLQAQQLAKTRESSNDACITKTQETFLKKDDPKILELVQQEQLLSSLAVKVNANITDQSIDNAWKALQDFWNQTKESGVLRLEFSDTSFQLENFEDLIEDLRVNNVDSQSSWRQPDLYEESGSSEYSTGSTMLSHDTVDKTKQAEPCDTDQDIGAELESGCLGDQTDLSEENVLTSCEETKTNDGDFCGFSSAEFSSPLQVTPLFRSLAAGIPSPKFSESERHFLLKTLGMESPLPIPSINPSQPPPCKRSLLHSL